jgi:hypothetical protein
MAQKATASLVKICNVIIPARYSMRPVFTVTKVDTLQLAAGRFKSDVEEQ